MSDQEKLILIKQFCEDALCFDKKPFSVENPYEYGYLSGIETIAEWILDTIKED